MVENYTQLDSLCSSLDFNCQNQGKCSSKRRDCVRDHCIKDQRFGKSLEICTFGCAFEGKTQSPDGKICITKPDLEFNCDSTGCGKFPLIIFIACVTGTTWVQDTVAKCEIPAVTSGFGKANCTSYKTKTGSTIVDCMTCEAGYTLQVNETNDERSCVEFTAVQLVMEGCDSANINVRNNKLHCTQCNTGFYGDLQGGNVVCSQCKNGCDTCSVTYAQGLFECSEIHQCQCLSTMIPIRGRLEQGTNSGCLDGLVCTEYPGLSEFTSSDESTFCSCTNQELFFDKQFNKCVKDPFKCTLPALADPAPVCTDYQYINGTECAGCDTMCTAGCESYFAEPEDENDPECVIKSSCLNLDDICDFSEFEMFPQRFFKPDL